MVKHAKDIEMTWDPVAAEASLPRDSAFTFMDLLVMTGQAPVEVPAKRGIAETVVPTMILAAANLAGDWRTAYRRAATGMRTLAAEIVAPAYNFMDLLAENGHTPDWARIAYGGRVGLAKLAVARGAVVAQDGWANDDWQPPANANEGQKVA